MRQSALASGGPCAIHIHDQPGCSRAITQLAWGRQWAAGKQILLKEGAQGLNRGLIKSGKKAREGRPVGELLAVKESHKRFSKGVEALIKGLQGRFARNGVAQEHHDKVDQVVLAKARPGEAHLLLNGLKDARMRENLSKSGYLLEYVIMPPFLIVWYVGLDIAAIREVVFHHLLSKRFSRACFCPGARL